MKEGRGTGEIIVVFKPLDDVRRTAPRFSEWTLKNLVRPAGFEPATPCLEVRPFPLIYLYLHYFGLGSAAQGGKILKLPQPRRNQEYAPPWVRDLAIGGVKRGSLIPNRSSLKNFSPTPHKQQFKTGKKIRLQKKGTLSKFLRTAGSHYASRSKDARIVTIPPSHEKIRIYIPIAS